METSEKHRVSVGIFVLLGTALLLGSVLLVGGDRYFLKSFVNFKVKLDQVQGLFEGSVVSLSGLTVGNVKRIDLDDQDQSLVVVVAIDKAYAGRVTEGSLASMQTQGALGDKYIYIKPGPLKAAPLTPGGFIEAENETDIVDLIRKRGPDITHFMDAAKQLNILLTGMNESGLGRNLGRSSQDLQLVLAEVRQMVRDLRGGQDDQTKLRQAVAHLHSILKKIDDGQGSLGALINDPALHNKILSLVGDSPRNKFLKPLLRESAQPASP
jgi:phospholipid/cholesterol/gamma-HCH transport system substrate-binding protein